MGKVKEIGMAIEELRRCGEALIGVADSLRGVFSGDENEQEVKEAAPTAKPIPLEKVRAVLAEKSVQGKRQEVQNLIRQYGVDRLSDIAPEHYADLLTKAGVL